MSNERHLRVIEGPESDDVTGGGSIPDPMVGQTIDGRYVVERMLGEGGMGVVYRAKHASLGKKFAIKVLRPEVSRNQEVMSRFKQEAQSASEIGNEHIIDISDFGTLPDGSMYFVMEFLEGLSLSDAIEQQRPFVPSRVAKIGIQLCEALGAAHERSIVHRDLKPDNIHLVKRSGDVDFVKVLDFGIAKVGGATDKKLTQAGQVFGTPHYMSPEQCAGKGVDHRTDIYALGIILYEMSVGRVPFDADNLMGILTQHMYQQPIAPREMAPPVDVPPGLEAIILKCLAKSSDARYASMGDLRNDLQRVVSGGTPMAVVQAVERKSSPSFSHIDERPSLVGAMQAKEMPQEPKRSMTTWIVGGVLLVGAVLGGYFAIPKDKPPVIAPGTEALVPQPTVPIAPPTAPPVAPETQPVAEPVAAAAPTVTSILVEAVPANAEVYREGSLIGTTPFSMPRPTSSEAFDLTLRADGYSEKVLRIQSFSPEVVRIELDRVRVRSQGNAGSSDSRHNQPTTPNNQRRPSGGEIVNPFD